jgi:hypothetical protein
VNEAQRAEALRLAAIIEPELPDVTEREGVWCCLRGGDARAVHSLLRTLAEQPAQEQATRNLPDDIRVPLHTLWAERRRQVEVEGWTPEHDDEHAQGDIARAVSAYADPRVQARRQGVGCYIPVIWPWSAEWWKPKDKRSNLIKAGALVLAEIERLDRAAAGAKP